jgi:Domain of unknown function (DUF4157)
MQHAVAQATPVRKAASRARGAVDASTRRSSAGSAERLPRAASCACGGSCPRCAAARLAPALEHSGKGHAGLIVGASNDPLEREADRVADQVLAARPHVDPGRAAPVVQRFSGASGGPAAEVPDSVHQTLAGPGQALDVAVRTSMEQRFGHDFSRVRVHAGGAAAQSARDVQALAYTVGNDLVFAPGRYAPGTHDGRRLLAHELTHVVQQSGVSGPAGSLCLQRQCDPAWATLPWAQRVSNAKAAAASAASNQCLTDMIDEALTPNVTVDQSTNTSPSVNAAAAAGRYTEWGTLSDLHINFDRNLNAKTHNATLFGETTFITPPGGSSIRIFIVLGPRALDPVGPQHTQMAAHHEGEHAFDFLMQSAMIGGTPHGATPGEELKIHAEGFSRYFLDLWTINNTALTFSISNDFFPMFTNYPGATPAEQNEAFDSIAMFYNVRITGIACNAMKFKIWLQMIQNARPASDALVTRINALPGLGLTRGTTPGTHFNASLACS